MRILPYGDTALLLDCADLRQALRTASAIRQAGLADVEDLVPGAQTVLVRIRPGRVPDVLRRLPDALTAVRDAGTAQPGPTPADVTGPGAAERVIEVRYDGLDLAEVGTLTGLGPDGVVAAHTGQSWLVAFCGFLPGFGYLVGGDERLHVPRRNQPRTRVPAGSVGLAGQFSGVYPQDSPGGWQLIGRTDAVLWDPQREPPATLHPGVRVRFAAC